MHDPGHERAASRVAAGIISPITGQRLATTWRIAELVPVARSAYKALEQELGVALWRDMRIWRIFRNETERTFARERGIATEEDGFWIEEAAVIDVRRLIEVARARWKASGKLAEGEFVVENAEKGQTVVLCTGAGLAESALPAAAVSKGEIITIAAGDLDRRTILNRGYWLLPGENGEAKVGATYTPVDRLTGGPANPTPAGRAELSAAARSFRGAEVTVLRHEAGTRLALDDKRPVVGWLSPNVGVCGALGSKGALFAPWLAAQWREHILSGQPFDPGVSVARLGNATSDV